VINKKHRKKVFKGQTSGVGSLIHKILSDFAKKSLESAKFKEKLVKTDNSEVKTIFLDGFRSVLHSASQDKDIGKWSEDEIELTRKSIERIVSDLTERYLELKNFCTPLEALKKLFIAVEWKFNHKVKITADGKTKELEIAGRIDWLTQDTNNKTLTLWDFKTSPFSNLERDIAQVAIYSVMIEEKLGVETAAALMYISGDTIKEHRIEAETLQKFKPSIFKIIYNMNQWLDEKENIPYTLYTDACEDCIVSKFCIETYGINPHLKKLGKQLKKEPIEELDNFQEDEENFLEKEIAPEKILIKQEKSIIEVDLKEEEKIDLEQVLEKESSNAILGKILQKDQQLEIHPNVFLRHVVTLGASGSGKTVLGKVLIEEILLQGYSAILIDPQGDLCSLLLPDDDTGKKINKESTIKIFTPNSTKGIKLTIDPLAPPADEVLQDQDTLLTYLDATATQVLDILGYNIAKAPPEKALLESILKEEWKKHTALDFRILAKKILEATVIRSVQDDQETEVDLLINARKQKELSQKVMQLVIGTEGSFFSGGETIDFEEMVKKKSQVSIINLASVGTDQSKRQLVVSWILRLIYDWLLRNPQREQDNIRFFLYIDEIADFLPIHPYNPPSKKMMMLLMRQARKYGCSIMIATQSPASIDYKAIDNIGTIFVGRIPSPQSLAKVEAYLEPYGQDAQRLVKKVQTVKPGEFLLIGGGYTKPEMFKTRWLHTKHETLSLDDIERLKEEK
jgi:hypothetical protein